MTNEQFKKFLNKGKLICPHCSQEIQREPLPIVPNDLFLRMLSDMTKEEINKFFFGDVSPSEIHL